MRKLAIIPVMMIFLASAHAVHAKGLISTSMEIEIGRSVRDDLIEKYGTWDRVEDVEFINAISSRLVEFTSRPGIEYEFYILDMEEINAFAAPGGFVFVTRGLLDFAERDSGMLAGVIAHEIGHVERKHQRDAMESAIYRQLGLAVLFRAFDLKEEWMEIAGGVALTLIEQGYSRDDEYDADRQGVRLTYRAGWDPETGMIEFLRLLDAKVGDEDFLGEVGSWFSSHPETQRRVMFAEEYLAEVKSTEPFEAYPLPESPPPPVEED